jgi:hypothetical protein
MMERHFHRVEGHRIRAKSILDSPAFSDADARVKASNELAMLDALK